MPEYIAEAYTPDHKKEWDDLVAASRNGTFLLLRDYMDYHSDRFKDCSLMIRQCRSGRAVGLLPACRMGEEDVCSHAGLTYGGLVLPMHGSDGASVLGMFRTILDHYRGEGIRSLRYKAIPHIYHRYPSEEDIYALFRCGATIAECNISSTIELTAPLRFNENARRNLRRAAGAGIMVVETQDLAPFWEILSRVLAGKYNTRPVHTLEEMELLRSRFPQNIRLFTAKNTSGATIGGTLLYYTGSCVHAQYIASSEEGRSQGALPAVFHHIISGECTGARFFDFGICNEDHGLYLNEGLLGQKNGMGGRATVYNIYNIDLTKSI